MNQILKFLLTMVLSLIGLFVAFVVVFALSNVGMARHSPVSEILSLEDKIRLAETIHLRRTTGNAVWPGFGDADIPAIVYNESYAFLVGFPDPPDGWIKVPVGSQHGGSWGVVPGDDFDGKPYVRQQLPESGLTPEAFTVLVGDRWVSSLQTFDWARISLVETIRRDLPDLLRPVFPYRLFVNQLIRGSDQYISLTAHEAFHAFQGMVASEKLALAEIANQQLENQYPWSNALLQESWQSELDILAAALQSTDPDSTRGWVQSFLDTRDTRRKAAGLSPAMIAYEQKREWLEGLARYAELEIWRQGQMKGYLPFPETGSLSDFDGYAGFESRWSRELKQMSWMAGDHGDGRFYYSGMAQAVLLDRFLPDWKSMVFEENVWLDDLLAAAISE